MQRRQFTALLLGSFLVGVLVLPLTAQAQQNVDRRQERQHWRIQRGLADGSLTRHEARFLRHEQRRLWSLEQQFRADGRLDRREHRILDRELDRVSQRINRLRHNQRYR